jgi:hypothetical protein
VHAKHAGNNIAHDKMMIDDDRKNSCHRNGSAQQLDTLQLSQYRDYSFKENRTEFVSRSQNIS